MVLLIKRDGTSLFFLSLSPLLSVSYSPPSRPLTLTSNPEPLLSLSLCFLCRQVTVQYRQDRGAMLPVRVHTIVVSVQHDEDICLDEMRDALKEKVVKAVVPCVYLDDDTIYHLQPSGRFVIGGPQVSVRLRLQVR